MRKATALFLLVITAIFAIRPVIAMHYCMGELHSFNLYQQHHDTAPLCAGHDTTTACCQSGQTEAAPPVHQAFAASWGECCDDTLLELSTDDYQNKTEPFTSRMIPNPVTEGMMLLGSVLNPSVLETDSFPSMQEFPPEGLFLKDISILTYICIYRI